MRYTINEAESTYKSKDLPIGAIIVMSVKTIAKDLTG